MAETVISGTGEKGTIGPSSKPVIVAERINPTNRKALAADIKEGLFKLVREEARKQTEAGAQAIDVNVSVPGTDEPGNMKKAVEVVQSATSCPVVLDSTSPDALRAGLSVVKGRPLVNSISGKEESLKTILPLVAKHKVPVVALAMDERGIPGSADERFAVARRIIERAEAEGVRREDVLVDCLVLAAATNQHEVMETLKAIRRVEAELGVNTILGVSNISFGLPNRKLLNVTFLAMALAAGLDAIIMDPTDEGMMAAVRSASVLLARDEYAMDYIRAYRGVK